MANSVYRVTEIVGTSTRSWEDAVKSAVQTAAKSLRDLRVAEVGALDVTVGDDGKVKYYRAKVKLSFKFEPEDAVRAAAEPVATAVAPKAAPAKAASKKKTSTKKVSKKASKKKSRRR
jgi:dodecin